MVRVLLFRNNSLIWSTEMEELNKRYSGLFQSKKRKRVVQKGKIIAFLNLQSQVYETDNWKGTYVSVVDNTIADRSCQLAIQLECMASWSNSRDQIGCTSEDASDLSEFLTRVLVRLWVLQKHHNPDDQAKRFLASTIKYCSGLQVGYRQQRRSTKENNKSKGPHCQKRDPTFKPSHPATTKEMRLRVRQKRKRE